MGSATFHRSRDFLFAAANSISGFVSTTLGVRMPAMAGTLYIVATPIGNLEDITQRALRVLREVDLIACEDTRHTRALLTHFGIKTATTSYHEHNELGQTQRLIKILETGQNIAVVSDAGTPLISDPGFRLVKTAVESGVTVIPIPGATAGISALSVSGLAPDQFFFAGFLPARAAARRAKLQTLRSIPGTLILYEAPHRIFKTLKDALEAFGDRQAVVARELTKFHEEIARGRLSELIARFSDQTTRGELVLLVSAATDSDTETADGINPASSLIELVNQFEKEGMDQKAALKKAARDLGIKRAEAYRQLTSYKNRRNR